MEKLVKSVDCLNCEPVSRSCVSQQQLSGWLFFLSIAFGKNLPCLFARGKLTALK